MNTHVQAEPIEITGIREHMDERGAPRRLHGSALAVAAAAVAVGGIALGAAQRATEAPLGPGRFVAWAVVALWCAAAVSTAAQRPQEPTAWFDVGRRGCGHDRDGGPRRSSRGHRRVMPRRSRSPLVSR